MTTDNTSIPSNDVELASFADASVVQLVGGDPQNPGALVAPLHGATVNVNSSKIVAVDGDFDWSWMLADLTAIIHGADEPWTILVVPGIADFGVSVPIARVDEFRSLLDSLTGPPAIVQRRPEGTADFAPPAVNESNGVDDVEMLPDVAARRGRLDGRVVVGAASTRDRAAAGDRRRRAGAVVRRCRTEGGGADRRRRPERR